jgi:hypothetical protein
VVKVNREVLRSPSEGKHNPGSQMGSQYGQTLRDALRQLATISAARWLVERRQATSRDGSNMSSKQRVAGSNPAGRAKKTAVQPAYRSVDGQDSLVAIPVMCHIRAGCGAAAFAASFGRKPYGAATATHGTPVTGACGPRRIPLPRPPAPRPCGRPRAKCAASREDIAATQAERRALSGLAPPA